ncbi:MAG: PspC domain-containing protein [Candidatus Yanofskybacteria bacterium]|nr:PspC domain-containing protein [Candidatus Yanofskybacteria bacterium]
MDLRTKRLNRSRRGRVIAGVASGIAEYFGIDPVFVRLLFLLLAFGVQWGPAIILYLILVIVLPEDTAEHRTQSREREQFPGATGNPADWLGDQRNTVGIIVLVLGLAGLFNHPFSGPLLTWSLVWPAMLILLGIFLLWRRRKPQKV